MPYVITLKNFLQESTGKKKPNTSNFLKVSKMGVALGRKAASQRAFSSRLKEFKGRKTKSIVGDVTTLKSVKLNK